MSHNLSPAEIAAASKTAACRLAISHATRLVIQQRWAKIRSAPARSPASRIQTIDVQYVQAHVPTHVLLVWIVDIDKSLFTAERLVKRDTAMEAILNRINDETTFHGRWTLQATTADGLISSFSATIPASETLKQIQQQVVDCFHVCRDDSLLHSGYAPGFRVDIVPLPSHNEILQAMNEARPR